MLRILTLLICCAPMLLSADGLWMTDFEAAKAKAKAENKDLLIDFTGSDWCGWCIKLKKEVFDHDSFKKAATEKFVLVELDYPSKKEQPAELKAQNQKLQQQYEIQGYPTILLTDHNGDVFGRTGYQAGGPEKYIEHLNTFTAAKEKRAALLKAAEGLEGMAKVEKLGAVLDDLITNNINAGQKEIAEQIKALDPEDSKGFWAKYEFPQKLKAVEDQLNAKGDLDAALATLTKLADGTTSGASKQQAYLFMAAIYKRGKNDNVNEMKYYKMAADADPESELSKNIYKFLNEANGEKQE